VTYSQIQASLEGGLNFFPLESPLIADFARRSPPRNRIAANTQYGFIVDIAAILTLLPTVVATLLYLLLVGTFAVGLSRRMRRRASPAIPLDRAPRVSILKPLAGVDDELYANLESFAAIDYPCFEILFGVASDRDTAIPIVQSFLRNHPHVEGRLIRTDPDAAINPKVAQLVALDARATGEIVVISDSNVRVRSTYLWSLVRELSHPGTGLVSSVFAGAGEKTLGAALENLQLGTWVAPGIVASTVFLKRPLSIGKSMAIWRRDLVRMGGFHVVANVLAEDDLLGRHFHEAGYDVRVSFDVVENRNVASSVKRTLERHSRWAKMRRALSPVAFALELLLTPTIVSSIVAIVVATKLAVVAAVATAALQTLCALICVRLLRGKWLAWYYAPLEMVRSGVVLVCWLRGCLSRRIVWRGHPFVVGRDSAIAPAPPSSWSRIRSAVQAAVRP
jgi:ceramide glucosyltransferase